MNNLQKLITFLFSAIQKSYGGFFHSRISSASVLYHLSVTLYPKSSKISNMELSYYNSQKSRFLYYILKNIENRENNDLFVSLLYQMQRIFVFKIKKENLISIIAEKNIFNRAKGLFYF